MNKLSLEQVLVPLIVSFFMSGLNSLMTQIHADQFEFYTFIKSWAMQWLFAYPCLLVLVPLARFIVQKFLFIKCLKP